MSLQGVSELACALFDARTRFLVLRLVQGSIEGTLDGRSVWLDFMGGASLDKGTLNVDLRQTSRDPADQLSKAAAPGPGHRAAPGPAPDLAAALARNLREDPLPEVRLNNLRALVKGHRAAPVADEALMAALADASDAVRLHAALALGERGWETLQAIA